MPTLLERQRRLAEFLSNPGQYKDAAAADRLARELAIPDASRLSAAGNMVANKRFGKIQSVMPKTMEILGANARNVFDGFARHCPPASISRAANARQFLEYLEQAEEIQAPDYICDVARFEYSNWSTTVNFDAALGGGTPFADSLPGTALVRLAPQVTLLVLDHDVRCLFAADGDVGGEGIGPQPERRPVHLAIAGREEGSPPRIFELDAGLHDAARRMVTWKTAASWCAAIAAIDMPDMEALNSIGLIEVKS